MCLSHTEFTGLKRDPILLGYVNSDLQRESSTPVPEDKQLLGPAPPPLDLHLLSPTFGTSLTFSSKRQIFTCFFSLFQNWSFRCQVISETVISEYDKLPVLGLLLQVWSFDALVISTQENYNSEQHQLLNLQTENVFVMNITLYLGM